MQRPERKIPKEVAKSLGYYVYLLRDPRSGKFFYVGKGVGRRFLSHFSNTAECRKRIVLDQLDAKGLEAEIEILAHALPDEETAFRIEAAVIDLLGFDDLTNQVRGWRSIQTGRMSIDQAIGYYAAKPIRIIHPALLIRINRLYRHNIKAAELYDITRGVWRLGRKREKARIALAVFEGVVREVYTIHSWHHAGSTPYQTRKHSDVTMAGRWEFLGKLASPALRKRYRHRSVAQYFVRGQQNPIVYVNC